MAFESQLPTPVEPQLLRENQIARLIEELLRRRYNLIAPTVRDGAVILSPIQSLAELPIGWHDSQGPGRYRLIHAGDGALFGCAVGPRSWKSFLYPAETKLWAAERDNSTFRILNNKTKPQLPFALFGVRPCDLAAIHVQDRVLTDDKYYEPIYSRNRNGAFIVVAQCTRSVETCFCAAMKTGRWAKSGFDLALTELLSQHEHKFIVRAGSERGIELLSKLDPTCASTEDLRQETEAIESAGRQQVRKIAVEKIEEFLYANFDNPRWEKVAERCLTCANCTLVCPTCFCTTVDDTTNLDGTHAERWRRWDSCFTMSFSYIHGGSVRASAKARYRQWLTHKLASWIGQFGTSGCVGCGRCITWCPAGIDLTEEVRELGEENHNGNS